VFREIELCANKGVRYACSSSSVCLHVIWRLFQFVCVCPVNYAGGELFTLLEREGVFLEDTARCVCVCVCTCVCLLMLI
jgi:hypothetical protein